MNNCTNAPLSLPADVPSPGLPPCQPATTPAHRPVQAGGLSGAAHPARRADIEGLRGIAVLAVLAVHAFPEVVRSGFIGVDIFFVLSGYLISLDLFRAVAQRRFDWLDFYVRRARRLLPALCTVLLACLVFGAAWTFPADARQLGHHVGLGALFASNIGLWLEAGYFDAASELKPLLHLWSLGIEEQFYIVWPAVAVLLGRCGGRAGLVLSMGLLLSFGLNVVLVELRPTGTFFLLPTRAWELMLGAWLAWRELAGDGVDPLTQLGIWLSRWVPLHRLLARQPHLLHDAASLLAGTLLVLAFACVDKTAVFPGWWALLPTLAAMLFIAAGERAWLNRLVLAHPLLGFYGAISYPLYLWHWPLLVFPLLLGVTPTSATQVLALVASVALAALTTQYIEQPLRHGRPTGQGDVVRHGRRIALALGLGLAAIGAGGWALQLSDGLLRSYPAEVQLIAATELDKNYGLYRAGRCFLDLDQGPERFAEQCDGAVASPASRQLMVWGDSHAAALYPGLAGLAGLTASAPLLAQYTKANCPPLLEAPPDSSARCDASNAEVLARIGRHPPATVVLGGNWQRYGDMALPALRRTVDHLAGLGVARIVVVSQLPVWTVPLPRVLLQQWRATGSVPVRTLAHLDPRSLATDVALRLTLAGSVAEVVVPLQQLCDAQGCLVSRRLRGVDQPYAFDDSHLTTAGSTALAELAFAPLLR